MAKVFVIGAAKGGTAKTVSSYNLAYSLAEKGKKVLAVDMDPQANLTTCFGVEDTADVPVTIGHLMMSVLEEEELPDASEYVWEREGVDFIPASMMLSAVDAKLRLEMGMLWSSIFVTHRTNNFVFHTGLQTVSDSHYKNVVLHGCTKYTQILILLDSVHHHYGSNVNL